MEEASTGTSAITPLEDADADDVANVNNLIEAVDLTVGADLNLRVTSAVEAPTSIVCNPNRSPRDRSMKGMKNKEYQWDNGYDSDREMVSFSDRTDEEG